MSQSSLKDRFVAAAQVAGAEVIECTDLDQAITAVAENLSGSLLCPTFPSGSRSGLLERLRKAGVALVEGSFRDQGRSAQGGLTGINFAMADTGTLALESTAEEIRLATMLPEKQFALLDPSKIYADALEVVPVLRQLHQRSPRNYVAYMTGPSRTADIERVLTIGVHGAKQLVILLVPGISGDPLEI